MPTDTMFGPEGLAPKERSYLKCHWRSIPIISATPKSRDRKTWPSKYFPMSWTGMIQCWRTERLLLFGCGGAFVTLPSEVLSG